MYESIASALLIAMLALYLRGLAVLRPRAKRGLRRAPVAAFVAGWATLAIALVSPLHEASEELFSAHMVQHELMMAIAAPLFVIARPLPVMLWALAPNVRRHVAGWLRARLPRRLWTRMTAPFDAWLLHAAAIWLWHIPLLFQSTLHSGAAHAAQHLSFFGSAIIFWWSVLQIRPRSAQGTAIVYLFTTAVHTSILGALLTFAHQPWYPEYAAGAAKRNLTPLGDQQLAGLIMWIPASVAYLVAALAIVRRWMRDSEWAVARRERSAVGVAS